MMLMIFGNLNILKKVPYKFGGINENGASFCIGYVNKILPKVSFLTSRAHDIQIHIP